MARERFPDDELAARKAFDAEETAAYAANLDAVIEEQGILEVVCLATSLWKELYEELREEGHVADKPPDGGNEVNDNDFVHLDNDDLDGDFLAELGDDHEAKEVIRCKHIYNF
jgi:hypothetical protein